MWEVVRHQAVVRIRVGLRCSHAQPSLTLFRPALSENPRWPKQLERHRAIKDLRILGQEVGGGWVDAVIHFEKFIEALWQDAEMKNPEHHPRNLRLGSASIH